MIYRCNCREEYEKGMEGLTLEAPRRGDRTGVVWFCPLHGYQEARVGVLPAKEASATGIIKTLASEVVELQGKRIAEGWQMVAAGERNLELIDKVKALQEEIARQRILDEARGR